MTYNHIMCVTGLARNYEHGKLSAPMKKAKNLFSEHIPARVLPDTLAGHNAKTKSGVCHL